LREWFFVGGEQVVHGEVGEVEFFFLRPGLCQGCQHDFFVDDADHFVGFVAHDGVDGFVAEAAGEEAVEGGGVAAALDVAEDADFDFPVAVFFDVGFDGCGSSGAFAFGDDDDAALFASAASEVESCPDLAEVDG